MKISFKIAILFFFLGTVSVSSQDISLLGKHLVTLESNISNKAYLKTSKKEKKGWQKKCLTVDSLKDLVELTNVFVSNYNSSTGNSLFHFPDIEYLGYCNALYNLSTLIDKEDLSFNQQELKQWVEQLHVFEEQEKGRLKIINELEEQQRDKERLQAVDSIRYYFENNYIKIINGAKKGSFSSIVGSDLGDKFSVSMYFGENSQAYVTVDQDDVYQFFLYYTTNKDEKLAVLIEQEIVGIVSKNLDQGFKEGKKFDGNFSNNFIKIFDFQGQKFADTAKQPSIELGIQKKSYNVYFSVVEPLFK